MSKSNPHRFLLTPFELKVVEIVCLIPRGQTRTYRWVAEKAGRPKAARAVGQALKKNPFLKELAGNTEKSGPEFWRRLCSASQLIPCHRVIRADGSLGGYILGEFFKSELLKAEANNFSKAPK